MKFRYVLGLVLLAALIIPPPEALHSQDSQVITFEETIPIPDAVLSQYCNNPDTNYGVEFLNTVRIFEPPVQTSSGTHALTNYYPGKEFGEQTSLKIRFTTGQSSVSMKVGLDRAYSMPISARLTAYTSGDASTGDITYGWAFLGSEPSPITQDLGVYSGSGNIHSVEVVFLSTDPKYSGYPSVAYEVIDDLTISTTGPLCMSDSLPPTVTITEPASDGQDFFNPGIKLGYEATDDVSGIAKIEVAFFDNNGAEIGSFNACNGPKKPPCLYEVVPIKSSAHYYMDLPKGTAKIRVTAWDFTNRSGYDERTLNLSLPGPALNIWLMGMEITQATQPWVVTSHESRRANELWPWFNASSSVPLISGKRTVVRVYPGIEGSDGIPVVGAEASLYCHDVSWQSCPGKASVSAKSITIDPADNNDLDTLRADASKSWNFVLPQEWTEWGRPIWLTAHVHTPGGIPECDGCDDGANGMFLQSVTFEDTAPLQLHLIWATVRRSLNSPLPSNAPLNIHQAVFQSLDSAFVQTYPVAAQDIQVILHNPQLVPIAWDLQQTDPGVLDVMGIQRWDAWLAQVCNQMKQDTSNKPPANLVYFGIAPAPTGFRDGQANWNCAVGKLHPDSLATDIPGIAAHEIGHALRRPHASCDHGEGGCESAPNVFPCLHGGICTYGFHTNHLQAISPGNPPNGPHAHDFMSYGDASTMWVSPYTYEHLYDVLHEALTANASPRSIRLAYQPPTENEILWLSGTITQTEAGGRPVARFDPFYHYADRAELVGPGEGRYSLELQDARGNVLYSRLFEPEVTNVDPPDPEMELTARFFEGLPFDDSLARVVLKYQDKLLASRERSANPPQVQLFGPRARSAWGKTGTEIINWEAVDDDHDELFFTVQYSVNGGQSWSTIVTDWTEFSLTVDSSQFAGSDNAMLRVLATDSLNTAIARSDQFTVANKDPLVWISSPRPPTSGALSFEQGSLIILEGNGTDLEDGPLGDTAFVWGSHIDGILGGGQRLDIDTLSPGIHDINLRGKDREGNVGSASVTIEIVKRINTQPVANADPDQSGKVGRTILLDGVGSEDADGDHLTFDWFILDGPPGSTPVLTRPEDARTGFFADKAGTYKVGLVVHDGQVCSLTDIVSIELTN